MIDALIPVALAGGIGFLFKGLRQRRQPVPAAKSDQSAPASRWTAERANAWYQELPWLSGANFIPSTAINQLEMWQADTFDPVTIDRELKLAAGLGFNTMRVYLHNLAWQQDRFGFKQRINTYLHLADRHGIRTIFVIFDDCWVRTSAPGLQPDPKPGIHNSGWLQCPGDPISSDPALFAPLEAYVKDILTTFRNDSRVLIWDLYNEPGNGGEGNASLPLLQSVFAWARAVNPSQPLTSGIWTWSFEELNASQVLNSDIVTYHDYEEPLWHQRIIEMLKTHGRPLICTEYMARTRNCRFENTLPMLKRYNVGAINWGLVDGKTNTKYAWDTPLHDGSEPEEWFHEIFRADGQPYRQEEVDLIRHLNGIVPIDSIDFSIPQSNHAPAMAIG